MISVIVPVFNQKEVTLECIDSVLSARVEQNFRLIVIDDASTDESMERALALFDRNPRVQRVRNLKNLGFTRTANRGMALARDDSHPLLLNSDTIVYDHWLDGLFECLLSRPKVGTVTPLTNQRGCHISCYPHPRWQDADFPELDDRALAELAYRKCRDACVDVHTGVGFCMLINRAAINSVGLFDSVNFPRGYGEESDFCYRTRGVGWRHLVCGGTFVTHLHAQSFGDEKTRLVNDMLTVFRQLHPSQPATDKAFRETDPVRIVRRKLDLARLSAIVETNPKSLSLSVYKKGDAPSGAFWLETVADSAVFRIAGSDIGVPNLDAYRLPGDFVRLAADLALLNISSLRFCGQPTLAKLCYELAQAMRIDIRTEGDQGTSLLFW